MVNFQYWRWEAALSKDFCNDFIKTLDWSSTEAAKITQEGKLDLKLRRTDVLWKNHMDPMGCITFAYLESANRQAGWNFDLTARENTQVCRYKSKNKGFYSWHKDTAVPIDGLQRKLTCVILLNDATEFEGGHLQIKGLEKEEEENLLTKAGDIIVFPSFLDHQVTPVTKGTRYSVVNWAIGPTFK